MKALTICQPYAELIVQGRKTCENRTWATPYRGLLYIHAGKSRSWLWDADDPAWRDLGTTPERITMGAVVAVAKLIACVHVDSKLMPEWVAKMTEEQREHVNGPWCWILDKVTPIGPWPWKGAQGLFEINDTGLDAIATKLIA